MSNDHKNRIFIEGNVMNIPAKFQSFSFIIFIASEEMMFFLQI